MAVEKLLEVAKDRLLKTDHNSLLKVYEKFSCCEAIRSNKQLFITIKISEAKLLLLQNNLVQFKPALDLLLKSYSSNEIEFGSGSLIMEIHDLEMKYYEAERNIEKIGECYHKMISVSEKTGVLDPRIMCRVHEVGAKLDVTRGKWDEAYDKFFRAFKSYQESGNIKQAKTILKYVLITNMIALKEVNPFHTQEAKAYQDDKELTEVDSLRKYFEELDIVLFEKTLNQIQLDEYLKSFVEILVKRIRTKVLLQKIIPFDEVSFQYLAKKLNNTQIAVVEDLLRELILLEEINGSLNQTKDILKRVVDTPKTQKENLENERLDLLTSIANDLTETVNDFVKSYEINDKKRGKTWKQDRFSQSIPYEYQMNHRSLPNFARRM